MYPTRRPAPTRRPEAGDGGLKIEDIPEFTPEESPAASAEVEAVLARLRAKREEAEDPRRVLLMAVPDDGKMDVMSMRWTFDRSVIRWPPVIVAVAVLSFKYGGGELRDELPPAFGLVLRYAEVWLALLLFAIPPWRASRGRVVLGYDAVEAPDKWPYPRARVRTRWEAIGKVEFVESPPRWRLSDSAGRALGELRWDMGAREKKNFREVVRHLLMKTHPLRVALEGDNGEA